MKKGNKRQQWPHAQMHFPAMTPDDALRVIELFERFLAAMWRAHGDSIADYLACTDPDSQRMFKPYDAQWQGAGVDRKPEDDNETYKREDGSMR